MEKMTTYKIKITAEGLRNKYKISRTIKVTAANEESAINYIKTDIVHNFPFSHVDEVVSFDFKIIAEVD